MIPYGRQTIDDDDIQAVVDVLRGDWLTQGPAIEVFERAVCEATDARFAVAYANGTAALHGACAAAGVGPGDRVATSPLSFVASANCARYLGAEVSFVDIDPATLNLDPTGVPAGLDAVVAVHFAGLPVDLSKLAERPRIVIEDAAQALGAATPDGPVGNCARSDMTCFSFHPVKPVTTAEGGVVTTNDPDLADRLRRFRTHGIHRPETDERWYYEVIETGFNYRLTDVQAALGTSQMRKLDAFMSRRREIAARYDVELAELDLLAAPQPPAGFEHGYHLYPIRVADRRGVYDGLRDRGIAPQVHYVPIHHHPVYASDQWDLPACDEAYAGILSLPIFPLLTDGEQTKVIEALRELVGVRS
ncbi:MAG: UDP-4-amino-4,6-dideoxy-N-acetyl-beta-L-altrosamine transaminase [Actinomycetota bacterium]